MPKLNTTTSGIITATLTADSSPTLDLQQNGVTIRTLGESQLVMGTAQSTATGATAYDFSGIPSWAKRITVMINGVSLSGTSTLRFRLGTGGTPTTSGYLGTAVNPGSSPISQSFTAGFDMYGALTAATAAYGAIVFTLIGSNAWSGSGNIGTSLPGFNSIAGTVSLSGALDFVRITTVNGTDTFDAGSVNIMWE